MLTNKAKKIGKRAKRKGQTVANFRSEIGRACSCLTLNKLINPRTALQTLSLWRVIERIESTLSTLRLSISEHWTLSAMSIENLNWRPQLKFKRSESDLEVPFKKVKDFDSYFELKV